MGSCMSLETPEPPVQQFQKRDVQQVQTVYYAPTGTNYPTVRPTAPPMSQPMTNYMPAYTYAQMPQQQQPPVAWAPAPYQYQMYPPSSQYPTFQIYGKTLTGKNIPLMVNPLEQVLSLKQKISQVLGTPTHLLLIMYLGKQLEDSRTLAEYSIQKDCVVHIVLRIQ